MYPSDTPMVASGKEISPSLLSEKKVLSNTEILTSFGGE